MERRITFLGEEVHRQQRFEFLYTAILVGNVKREANITTIRREAKLLDALDAISDPPNEATATHLPNNERVRTLRSGDQHFNIGQDVHEMLKKYLEEAPWTSVVARKVVDCVDWFSAAPEVKD